MIRGLLWMAAVLPAVPAAAQSDAELGRVLAVARELERQAAAPLWPGFRPMDVPLAVFAGEGTYLFRHPAPPEGFVPVVGARPAVHRYPGRHPAVTSNTSIEFAGVTTATLLADGPRAGLPAGELAATALHEAFHVFQRQRHPTWEGNEGDLLLYPVEDARLLALRRFETAALKRALAATDHTGAACWARAALTHRRDRFAGMDAVFGTYERRSELNEGLATYVQLRALGRATVEISDHDFAPAEVRHRIYAVGPALALLLDRFRPGWPGLLEADDQQAPDELLDAALHDVAAGAGCGFTPEEVARVESEARRDAAAVVEERQTLRREFAGRPGWRLEVVADGEPLWPQRFDPLNLVRVNGGLLHSRYLRLGNGAGHVQAVDGPGADLVSLTEGAGSHPLFNGVRRLTIAGLADAPEVREGDGVVELEAPGVTASFTNAAVERLGTTVRIRLGPGR